MSKVCWLQNVGVANEQVFEITHLRLKNLLSNYMQPRLREQLLKGLRSDAKKVESMSGVQVCDAFKCPELNVRHTQETPTRMQRSP